MLFMKAAIYDKIERGDTEWLWNLADEAFESAIATSSDSQLMLCEWGSMLLKHAKRVESSDVRETNHVLFGSLLIFVAKNYTECDLESSRFSMVNCTKSDLVVGQSLKEIMLLLSEKKF